MKIKSLTSMAVTGLMVTGLTTSALAATDSQANLAQQANNPIANMISVPL